MKFIMNKNSNAIFIILSSFITYIGNGMQFIALSWIIFEKTQSSASIGLLVLLETIPGIIISPLAGVIVDRVNKKNILIVMDFFRAIVILPIPFLLLYSSAPVWLLYTIAMLVTMGGNFFYPALSSLIKEVINQEDLSKTISANGSSLQLGMIIGSGVAGLAINSIGVEMIFVINIFSYIISGLILMLLPKSNKIKNKYINKNNVYRLIIKDLKDGFNYLISSNSLIRLILLGLSSGCVISLINAVLISFTQDTLELGVKAYGILDASIAVGSLLMGIILIFVSINKDRIFIINLSIFIMAACSFFLGITDNFFIALFGLFLIGIFSMLEGINRRSLILEIVDKDYIGRIESLNWAIFSSISPIFALIVGYLVDYTNASIAFVLLAIFLVLLLILVNTGFKNKVTSKRI